ncbi:MAG: hypothetical protein IKN56_05215, partial [Clostridia bacterium]|nr:hypothetical protein [Clostridia bacterium]
MQAYFKAVISLIEIIFFAVGIIPVKTQVSYGGERYIPQAVTDPMKIVEGGYSEFDIIIPDDCSACINTASSELQDYIERISGASMPIVSESNAEGFDNSIILGDLADDDSFLPEHGDLDDEGFLIFSDGQHLVIKGGTDRGTLY